MNIKSWHCLTVCGMKGTGKTTLIKRGLLPQYKEVFVFDPNGEYSEFPNYEPETDRPEELENVAKTIWDRWNCLLVVSEAELYLPVNKPLAPSIFKIVARGRHRNIGLIADTRRIANLNKTVFGLSEHAFVFRHFSPTDINYLNQFLTEDARKLASLKDYFFWHYTKGKVTIHKPLKVKK
ncbi:MAG: hypothetical protein DDT31_01138 [Syntrophomonadaceae bacterium]|nr:hypothetical protein [Bacillota bacterium]